MVHTGLQTPSSSSKVKQISWISTEAANRKRWKKNGTVTLKIAIKSENRNKEGYSEWAHRCGDEQQVVYCTQPTVHRENALDCHPSNIWSWHRSCLLICLVSAPRPHRPCLDDIAKRTPIIGGKETRNREAATTQIVGHALPTKTNCTSKHQC